MNILILHNVENLHNARRSTLEYIFSFQRYRPEHAYWYHRIAHPPSDVVRETSWDAVILESTALGICTVRPRELFDAMKDRWSFLADPAISKVVFPQDDPNCGGLMDDWFAEWGVQNVFSVRAREHWSVLYPKAIKSAAFHSCLPGYIDDRALAGIASASRPWTERSRLLGQRVTMYPARGGRQGRLKGLIAQQVKAAAERKGLVGVDISVDPAATLFGEAWYAFLGDCRFVLGSEGGLSVNDPYGEIADAVDRFVANNPHATYEEIEAACFPGLDGVHVFSGFSPRILEAAMCGASQVLVEGDYLGLLEPGRHYLPLKADASNIDDVFEAMNDSAAAQARIAACQQTLVDNTDLRYSALAARVLAALGADNRRASGSAIDPLHARRSYLAALLDRERATGFEWPASAERAADAVAAQTPGGVLTEEADEPVERVALLAFLDAFALEASRLSERATDSVGVGVTSALQRYADHVVAVSASAPPAGDSLPALTALRAELAALPLAAMAREASIDTAALVRAIAGGGEIARLCAALVSAPSERLLGLATRLGPEAQEFTAAELGRLEALDSILVRAGPDGLEEIERFQAYGERATAMLDLLARGGDLVRLVEALSAAGPAAAGIVSRLLPVDGVAYTPAELAWLEQVDRILIRSERRTGDLDAIEAFQQSPPKKPRQ